MTTKIISGGAVFGEFVDKTKLTKRELLQALEADDMQVARGPNGLMVFDPVEHGFDSFFTAYQYDGKWWVAESFYDPGSHDPESRGWWEVACDISGPHATEKNADAAAVAALGRRSLRDVG